MDEIKSVLGRAHIGSYLFARMHNGVFGICKVINREGKRGRGGFTKIKILFADKQTREIHSASLETVRFLRLANKEEIKQFQDTVEFPQHGATKETPPQPRIQIVEKYTAKFEITEGQMLFFRYAGLKSFPCTAAELKLGRTKVLLALHPDTSQRDSSHEFKMADLAYETLKGLCK